jgi:hypothetical protein
LFPALARWESKFARYQPQNIVNARQVSLHSAICYPLSIATRPTVLLSFELSPFLDQSQHMNDPSKRSRNETKRLSEMAIDCRLRQEYHPENFSDWGEQLYCQALQNGLVRIAHFSIIVAISPGRFVWAQWSLPKAFRDRWTVHCNLTEGSFHFLFDVTGSETFIREKSANRLLTHLNWDAGRA